MSNAIATAAAWSALLVEVGVGVLVLRQRSAFSALVLTNLVAAAAVVIYWAVRWVGYLTRGVTWYASDQLLPAGALVVCILAVRSLIGDHPAVILHWIIFGALTLTTLAAAFYFSFVRFNRLM